MTGRLLWVLALSGLLLAVAVPFARSHGGHAVITQEEAVAVGRDLVGLLITRGKIPGTWSGAGLDSASLEMVDGLEEWHLVFANDGEPEASRRRLYIFLNYDGQVLGANFSGESR